MQIWRKLCGAGPTQGNTGNIRVNSIGKTQHQILK
jgi:hypothetical protein